MKVSVIIPLYNKERYIQRTLDSVFAQTLPEFELIIVDDGSTDQSAAIAERCTDSRLRLIRQPNAGPGAARNRGIAEAKSEFVAFLDADDEWCPTFLEKSLACFEQYNGEVACVASGYYQYPGGDSMETFWEKRGLTDAIWRYSPALPALFAVHLLAYLSPWNTVARREVILKWGGFFDQWKCLYAEDSFLWLKVLLNEAVAVQMEPLVKFHSEASGLSGNLNGPRPIEPKLLHPDEIRGVCPDKLLPLLDNVLAIRAIKTACMLSYWGNWREARRLLGQFCGWSRWRLPRFAVAQLAATPVGAGVGKMLRLMSGVL